ncbi:MAG: acyl-CoA dehydrogenase family protein [Dehalococcoidia bacterium]|jgi:alkylation response protein AidB-like acyl-CoA dehydrogenase|nr:acyl-CoA dehydrogenase family protein [Dehalococcoidia bacterium]
MDFRFTPEEEAFREEVAGFVSNELPPYWLGAEEEYTPELWPVTRAISAKLGQRGWLSQSWPKEYGGQQAPVLTQLVFQEEANYWGIPGTGMGIGGTAWVAPCLLMYGTPEQKQEHLPPIASGERFWCTGYSEPGSGSDLASLSTRARLEGNCFIVDGQKVWTSAAHVADWCWLAVRTDPSAPQHKGISMLLVDMKTPGITVRPLINMAGAHSFNEVYFDNVRVPRSGLVGELNRGWYVVMTALDFERAWPGVRYASMARRILDEMLKYALQVGLKPQHRTRLAQVAVEAAVGRAMSWRVVDVINHDRVPNFEASEVKVFTTEVVARSIRTGLEILGLYGQLAPESPHARLQGWLEQIYQIIVGHLIAGGSSEVQRNIIAIRGLGLPR